MGKRSAARHTAATQYSYFPLMDYLIEKHPAKTMAAVLLLGVSALVFLF
ncbi:hypothetical protein [Oxalicibacterium solurbis]|nr:hypothetical protein [Oxalicibacterium solurbis]